jgi:hypothetical protein
MPFLRRRGNMASETDMRRHTHLDNVSNVKQNLPEEMSSVPLPSQHAAKHQSGEDQDGMDDPSQRPPSPPIQDETAKHRRFSVLRFRNASDSQLSLRAKQQAERLPPVPRRGFSPS